MDNELYLVRYLSPEVEVYDAASLTLQRHLAINEVSLPFDLVSSTKYRCLYVADLGHAGRDDESIHRVDLNGNTTKWRLGEEPSGLSVTPDGSNIIVTCRSARKLQEYADDGKLMREIFLQEDIVGPLHAIQLISGQFVVCHCGLASESQSRLSVTQDDGQTDVSYGVPPWLSGDQTVDPSRMILDKDGLMIVTDVNNARILLMSTSLDDVRELVSRRNVRNNWYPFRLCLDEKRGRLYVAEWEWEGKDSVKGCVLTFQVSDVVT